MDGLRVAFPYPYIYPEQYSYMLSIKRALDVYATQPSTYKQMVHACMGQDLSWTGPAKEWERELLSMKAGGSWAAPGEDKIECVVEAKKPHNVAKPF